MSVEPRLESMKLSLVRSVSGRVEKETVQTNDAVNVLDFNRLHRRYNSPFTNAQPMALHLSSTCMPISIPTPAFRDGLPASPQRDLTAEKSAGRLRTLPAKHLFDEYPRKCLTR